ncbi:MAG: GHKL domain-containing protein [Oscillospiraceae bacterium]|nr:GHKL domain-containing protein [Oscillospiraceae bacterium]
MIYTVAEYIATILDSIILVGFLIYALSFREMKTPKKIFLSLLFAGLFFATTTVLNSFLTLEGVFIVLYCAVLFCFARIALKGTWLRQFLAVLVELAAIFFVNSVITIISSLVLKEEFADLLSMRNAARISLLCISKIALVSVLLPVAASIRERKFVLHFIQMLVSVIALIVSITAGNMIEKMVFEHYLTMRYATIIMCCLAIIDILLLFIMMQFSAHNQAVMNQVALQTRLRDDEEKLKETLQWDRSVRTLQHDLNNHMTAVTQYIECGDTQNALSYIKKITGTLSKFPSYTNTGSRTLNAIVDLKRMICKEEKIDLKCYIQTDLADFDDVSFSTIFGNLMDNAIEAEKKEPNKEIRISLEMAGSFLHITIQNRIHQPVLVNGEMPDTSKKDKQNHGLGLYSVTETIERCHGVLDISENEEWIIADVLLPCTEISDS